MKKDVKQNADYYTGFAEGVKIHTEVIQRKIKREIDDGTIKIEYGTDRLFDIINYLKFPVDNNEKCKQ